jgi:hypothetical protein
MASPIVSELLCVLKCNFGKYPKSDLITTFADFYTDAEVESAKGLLVGFAEKCNPKPDELKVMKARVGDGKIRRSLDDIFSVYTVLDGRKEKFPAIYAVDTSRIPSMKDFELSKLSEKIDDIGQSLAKQICDLSNEFKNKLVDFKDLATGLLDEARSSVASVSSEVRNDMKACTKTLIDDVKASVSLATSDAMSSIPKSSAALTAEAVSAMMLPGTVNATSSASGDPNGQDCTNPWMMMVKGKLFPVASVPSNFSDKTFSSAGGGVPGSPGKAHQPRRKIVGSAKQPDAKLMSSSKGQWNIFVGRLGKDTGENDIKEFLEDCNIGVFSVRKLKPTQDWQEKSSAFCVTIALNCKDIIMDPAIWPDNVEVRDWVFKPKA